MTVASVAFYSAALEGRLGIYSELTDNVITSLFSLNQQTQ